MFDVFKILFALISTVTAAYQACFGQSEELLPRICMAAIEIFFAIDFFTNFMVSYKNIEDDKMVYDHRLIATRYLKSFFIWDFIATFPFINLLQSNDNDDPTRNETLQYFMLLKLFRILKLQKVMDTKAF